MPRIWLIAVLFISLSIGVSAQRYQDSSDEPHQVSSDEPPEMASCDDDVVEYQEAVKKCLNEADTLAAAKECWQAEP